MAETVLPSVRGIKRIKAGLSMLAGAVLSAFGVGFVVALVGSGLSAVLPTPSLVVTGGVAAAGLVLDLVNLISGRLRPLTLGRQVPREWGRLLPAPVTAALYGARLGVGPLTILSTWTWWSTLIAASLVGVWTTVAVSVWFAVVRVLVNAAVSQWFLGGRDRVSVQLRGRQRQGHSALTTLGAALVLSVLILAGCATVEAAGPTTSSTPTTVTTSAETATEIAEAADASVATESANLIGQSTQPSPTTPAVLEDFVQTTTSVNDQTESTTSGDEPAVQSAEPEALAAVLPTTMSGMALIDDDSADRFLTIDQAAAIQPDPTEEIALLETRGYQGGWVRAFRSPNADVAVTSVYQFEDDAEAAFYLEDGLITIGGYGGDFFDVPGLPGVRGFHQEFDDDGEPTTTMGGAFSVGSRWYLLYLIGSPQTVTADVLVPALAQLQAASS